MTNEVKNVPELRFSDFSDEWEEKKLEDLLKFNNGINASKEQYGTGMKFINVLDILNTNFITYDKIIGRVNVSKAIENRNKVEYGDILFLRSSETREDVGMCNVYLDKEKHSLYGGFIIRGKKIGEYSPFFLKILLNNSKARKSISSLAGGSTRFNVSQDILKVVGILVPKMNEQIKIGEFFSKLDQQIELEEKKLSLLEEQKKGYMQKIFSQELRFKDENGEDYPEWKERKFSELLSYSSNGVDKKINKNHDIAYMVNYMDVFKKTKLNTKNRDLLMEITATKIQKEKNNLKKGDILFTPSSETREDIAKSTVVFEDLDNTVYSYHLIRLRPLDSNIFSLKYSNYLSEQNFISKQFRRLAQGAQRYTLTKEYFENIKLNLPHIKEQEKIGDFFSKLDEVINKQSQKIDELKLRKQGFLQKMFV